MHFFFFFQNYAPFFGLDFLFPIKHPTAERGHLYAVLLLLFVVDMLGLWSGNPA